MENVPSSWVVWRGCPAQAPAFTSLFCTQNGARIQLPPGLHACFLRNLTLPMYCLSLVFISWYLICDSESTKNSFLLRCPPHAISSWEKNHILHYSESCLIVPSTGKKCNHWVIRQFGRRWWQILNEILAVNQIFFAAILIWTGVKMLQQWGKWGRELCL